MNTLDCVHRFDSKRPSVKPPPPDADAARRTLEDGNRMVSRWKESCRTRDSSRGEPRYVVQCSGREVARNRVHGQMPEQSPFAAVVGCTDARVPREMLFGQGFNDLFNHQISLPVNSLAPSSDENVNLVDAPTNPKGFSDLAAQMAQILHPEARRRSGGAATAGNGQNGGMTTTTDATSMAAAPTTANGGLPS